MCLLLSFTSIIHCEKVFTSISCPANFLNYFEEKKLLLFCVGLFWLCNLLICNNSHPYSLKTIPAQSHPNRIKCAILRHLFTNCVRKCASTMLSCVAEISGVSSVTLEMGKPTHWLLSLCFPHGLFLLNQKASRDISQLTGGEATGVRDITEWKNTCSGCRRPWVWSPTLKHKQNQKAPERWVYRCIPMIPAHCGKHNLVDM